MRNIPQCFIRIDIAHLIKSITTWKSLQTVTNKVKQFFIRAIGLVILSTTLEDVEKLIGQIFVVALSETEGKFI